MLIKTKSEMEVRTLQASDDLDDFVTTVCDPAYTPRYYGHTPSSVPERFLDLHFNGGRPTVSTVGAEIWIVKDGPEALAYFTMLRKRWGTAKASTFIVKKRFQRQGIGRRLHEVVEGAYDQDPSVRKIFHTAPVPETGHLRLDLEFGYRIEGHLRAHYTAGCDELVLGRRPEGREVRIIKPVEFSSGLVDSGAVRVGAVRMGAEGRHPLSETLAAWMAGTHAPVDCDYTQSLVTPTHSRSVLVARSPKDAVVGVMLLTRKRERLCKVLVQVDPARPSRRAFQGLLQSAIAVASGERLRKVYTEVPDSASEMIRILKRAGFLYEAHLDSPYKDGADMALLSLHLE